MSEKDNGFVQGSEKKSDFVPRYGNACLGTPIKKSPSTNEKGTTSDGNVGTGTGRQTFSEFVKELER